MWKVTLLLGLLGVVAARQARPSLKTCDSPSAFVGSNDTVYTTYSSWWVLYDKVEAVCDGMVTNVFFHTENKESTFYLQGWRPMAQCGENMFKFLGEVEVVPTENNWNTVLLPTDKRFQVKKGDKFAVAYSTSSETFNRLAVKHGDKQSGLVEDELSDIYAWDISAKDATSEASSTNTKTIDLLSAGAVHKVAERVPALAVGVGTVFTVPGAGGAEPDECPNAQAAPICGEDCCKQAMTFGDACDPQTKKGKTQYYAYKRDAEKCVPVIHSGCGETEGKNLFDTPASCKKNCAGVKKLPKA